jgi:hypothetical protein
MHKIIEQKNEVPIPHELVIEPWNAWWTQKIITNPPTPKYSPPQASPLLPNHLTDILYSFCYSMRLYNGDVSFDFEGAADVILSISTVLTSTIQFSSVKNALKECIEKSKRPDIFVEYQWQVEVVHDVELCLQTRNHVFRALSETMIIIQESKLKKPNLKLQFFFAWAQSLTVELLFNLRKAVHEYYTSLTALLIHIHERNE